MRGQNGGRDENVAPRALLGTLRRSGSTLFGTVRESPRHPMPSRKLFAVTELSRLRLASAANFALALCYGALAFACSGNTKPDAGAAARRRVRRLRAVRRWPRPAAEARRCLRAW